MFTHFKLCVADAIHNFKWVKITQTWQNEVHRTNRKFCCEIGVMF